MPVQRGAFEKASVGNQLAVWGGLVAFALKGDLDQDVQLLERLPLFRRARRCRLDSNAGSVFCGEGSW